MYDYEELKMAEMQIRSLPAQSVPFLKIIQRSFTKQNLV
jgi:hypothetical protein